MMEKVLVFTEIQNLIMASKCSSCALILQYNLIITVSLGSIEISQVISETML